MRAIAGTHLIVDAYVNNNRTLTKPYILEIFRKLVKTLAMEYLDTPLVWNLPIDESKLDSELDEGGISVIVPITTSHLSAHCWPARNALMLDVFSCKPFSVEEALDLIRTEFGVRSIHYTVVDRIDPEQGLTAGLDLPTITKDSTQPLQFCEEGSGALYFLDGSPL